MASTAGGIWGTMAGTRPAGVLRKEETMAECPDREGLVNLICTSCQFHKEADEDLECGAFVILKRLLERGVITPAQVADALRD